MVIAWTHKKEFESSLNYFILYINSKKDFKLTLIRLEIRDLERSRSSSVFGQKVVLIEKRISSDIKVTSKTTVHL